MTIPIYHSAAEAVAGIFGSGRSITGRQGLSGGDINEAYQLILDDGSSLFMKRNSSGMLDSFRREAEGLAAIEQTGTIHVPKVLGLGLDGENSFLLLEFLQPGKRRSDFWECFACELAGMHDAPSPLPEEFGFFTDNYIGSAVQDNRPMQSWVSFFRDCRLRPQFKKAERYFDRDMKRRADRLLVKLEELLTEPEKPSLLHGDLWGGNFITGPDGRAWLIDPAVYVGHREADLAMTELFGGFSPVFYTAYRRASGIDEGYEQRRDLYNLYHLLNHLNLFGISYLPSVLNILYRS